MLLPATTVPLRKALRLFLAAILAVSGAPAGVAGPSGEALPTAPDGAALWTVVEAEGRVEALPSGLDEDEWIRLQRGDGVEPLSELRARRGGRATIERHGDAIVVDAGGAIVLPDPLAEETRVKQRSGGARYHVRRREEGRFEVLTPSLVAVASGTTFSVTVREDFTAVAVSEGAVRVRARAGAGIRDLVAGDVAVVDAANGGIEVHRGSGAGDVSGDGWSSRARRARKDAGRLGRGAAGPR